MEVLARRRFVKIAGAAGLVAFGGLLAGCGESRGSGNGGGSAEPTSEPAPAPESAPSPAPEPAPEPEPAPAAKADAIVIYFSRADENYSVGYITEGNTAVLAGMVADITGADTFEIVPTERYPEEYQACCDQAQAEQRASARPTYVGEVDLADYQTVYLGYPIWWGKLPMCVYTFIEAHDWDGKTIHPFCTHEGSGVSGTDSELKRICAGATVEKALNMTGTRAQTKRDDARADVEKWLG